MNGVLNALATAAPLAVGATPTNPLLASLGATVPVVIGAVIGYLFSTMRDWSKTKTERAAKYQDQVLEATSELLASALKIKHAATAFGFATMRAEHTADDPLDSTEAKTDSDKLLAAMAEFYATVETARPHELTISILAPNLAPLAKAVVETASQPDFARGSSRSKVLTAKHAEATEALTDAVREHLKVPTARRRAR